MSSGSVNLDIIFKYISDKSSVKKAIDEIKTTYTKSFEKQEFYNDPIKRKMMAEKEAIKDISSKIKDIVHSYEKLNRQGHLSHLFDIGKFTRKRKDQIRLNKEQFEAFMLERIPEELKEEEKKKKGEAKKQKEEDTKNIEKTKKKTWQEIFMGSVKGLTSRNPIFDQMKKFYIQQDKDAKARQREQNKQQKEFWNKMFLRWGKLGVWGLITQQAIKYISKAVGFAYSTSMQGLDWQRTISGGASGGSWFGKDIAAYQRAGIGANQLQGFKRGVQGYLGSVKLGMGNAAPLMYLGLSALGNPDELEKELERGLRRLPKDVSLALAGQMGLDYNMWEAIYSGRLDRERSAYSEEAIQQWSELAKGLNELITNINTFFFNYLAPIASSIGEFLQRLSEGKTGIGQSLDIGSGYVSRLVKVALYPIEVIVKNEKGEVLGKSEAQPDYNNTMLEYQGN